MGCFVIRVMTAPKGYRSEKLFSKGVLICLESTAYSTVFMPLKCTLHPAPAPYKPNIA